MNKIVIYYGPKSGFKKILPCEFTTLTEVVRISDSKHHKLIVTTDDNTELAEIPYYENLVAYSEAYAGITESAVQSFISLLSNYDIDELYLQNPTTPIKQQIEQAYPGIIDYKKYSYRTITPKMFAKISTEFSNHIIGQNTAKERLLVSLYPLIRKANNKKPTVIMLYGVSGVGKTETAKFISDILGQKLFRKQFSMFHSEEFSSYLFGGNHTQSCFAKDLLERESNIILMDEFDKPAPVFHSAFYQMFDEGVFEDKNYQVDLSNAIIFCTSNYQSEEDIRKNLGDPIFYRFDKFIKYNPLSIADMKVIIEKLVTKKYNKLNKEEQKIIKFDELISTFLQNSQGFKNVRHLANIVDEYIGIALVHSYIDKISMEEYENTSKD